MPEDEDDVPAVHATEPARHPDLEASLRLRDLPGQRSGGRIAAVTAHRAHGKRDLEGAGELLARVVVPGAAAREGGRRPGEGDHRMAIAGTSRSGSRRTVTI